MNWEDECYLLSKRKFRENANIINVFTKTRGRVNGIVYGGNSRKIRNYLQISNKLFVINNTKNESKIGYLKTELIKAVSPNFFSDKKRISALTSLSSILNSLLPESQPYKELYNSLENFINSINLEHWIILYIYFEINLIKELGYDTNLKKFDIGTKTDEKYQTVKIDGINYEVPLYLIRKEFPKEIEKNLIKKSLNFTRNLMLNNFYTPNNFIFPKSRIILENYFS